MNPRFRITVGSEPDYEDLVGDLYFDGQIVAVLTQERGFDAMEIQLHGPPTGGRWTFDLADFEAALSALKRRMWELRRTESEVNARVSVLGLGIADAGGVEANASTDAPEPNLDHPLVAPEPTPQETADALRRMALHACDMNEWAECLESFERAATLDPAGDAKPWVQKAQLKALSHVDEK
jgi:hypothetical protein